MPGPLSALVQPSPQLQPDGETITPPTVPPMGQPPAMPPSPPVAPPNPDLEDLKAAQVAAAKTREYGHGLANTWRMIMMARGKDPTEVDEDKIQHSLQGPLQDLLQQQAYKGQQVKQGFEQAQTAHTQAQVPLTNEETRAKAQGTLKQYQDMTPGSQTNQARAQQLNSMAQQFGVGGVDPIKFTADQEAPFLKAIEAKSQQEGVHDMFRARMAEVGTSREALNMRDKENREERAREADQRAEIAREKEAKEKAPKTIPQPSVEALDNSLSSMDSIEDLKQKHAAVGASALTGGLGGAAYAYEQAQTATEGQLGKAMYPTTRGTGGAELVRKQEPGNFRGAGSAAGAWDEMHKKIYEEANNHLKTLEANPAIDQTQVKAYRQRLEEQRQKYGIGGAEKTKPPEGFVPGLPSK